VKNEDEYNGRVSNSSSVSASVNWTGLVSVEGGNEWTVYCNDSDGNEGVGSVSFYKEIGNFK